MNLEELQGMSDAELNTLAAIKFLWGGIVNVPSDDWNPTNDMNQATQLLEGFQHVRMTKNHSGGWIVSIGQFDEYDLSLPRCITIASILAKESDR